MKHALRSDESQAGTRSKDHNPLELRQLAHELNSILDGSLRLLGLVQNDMRGRAGLTDASEIEAALHRLEHARTGLLRIAAMLESAMTRPTETRAVFEDRTPLAVAISHMVAALTPAADQCGTSIEPQVDPGVRALPTGALGPLMLNALRNAINACASQPVDPGAEPIRLIVRKDRQDHLSIEITDPGSGLASSERAASPRRLLGGHGIGLEVCRRIVTELEGTLELADNTDRPGATFRARVPLRSLKQP